MKCNIALNYILLFLLALSNNLIIIFIQCFLILFINKSKEFSIKNNSLKISLLFSLYDIFRIIFSYCWDVLKRITGTHIPITISLFLLSFTHIVFSQTIMSSLLDVIVIRCIMGIFNPLSMYSMISFCEMFSSKDQKKIGNLVNLIKNLTGALLSLLSAYIPFNRFHIVTFAIGIINLITAVLYIIQFKCQVKINNVYEFQENEIEISKSNNYSQSNSLYHGPKLRNPNNENNSNHLNNNPKRNKSIDSSTNKNFKQLNSESIDNNLDQINKISGKESNENGKMSSLVNGSIDKKLFNMSASTQIQRKFNFQINSTAQNNMKTTFPQTKFNQPGAFSTNQTNQPTPKDISSKIGTLKKIITFEERSVSCMPFVMIYSLIQLNFYLSFFTFVFKLSYVSSPKTIDDGDYNKDIIPFNPCLIISLYYFSFILFIPLNNFIMKIFISANDKPKRIKVYHIISIISLTITSTYYTSSYFLKWENDILYVFIQFSLLIIKNESLLIHTSCINILILHLRTSQLQERYSRHQKKLCVLISYTMIAFLLFIDYYFIETTIIVILSYYLMPIIMLVLAYIIGIATLFKQK